MDITFNNYTDCMRIYDELDKEYILLKHIKLYNEMSSFINDNIIELNCNNKLYTEEVSNKNKKWYEKVWDWIKKIWGKIVKFFTDIFNKIKTFFTGNKKKIENTKKEVEKNKEKIKEKYENSSVGSYVSAVASTISAATKASSPLAQKDTTQEDKKVMEGIMKILDNELSNKKYSELSIDERRKIRNKINTELKKIQNRDTKKNFQNELSKFIKKILTRNNTDLFKVLSDKQYASPRPPFISFSVSEHELNLISNIQSTLDLSDLNNAIYTFFLIDIPNNILANNNNWMYIGMNRKYDLMTNCIEKFKDLSTLNSYKKIFKIEETDKSHDEYISVMSSLRYLLEILSFEIAYIIEIFSTLESTNDTAVYNSLKNEITSDPFIFIEIRISSNIKLGLKVIENTKLFEFINDNDFDELLKEKDNYFGTIGNPNFPSGNFSPSQSFMNFFQSALSSMIELLKLINDSATLVNKSTNDILNDIDQIIKSDSDYIEYLKYHKDNIEEV